MTKAGLLYHVMRKLLKNNNNANIVLNNPRYHIPQVEGNKNQYITCDVNRSDHERQFQLITDQPVKQILNVDDKNIIQNYPIL